MAIDIRCINEITFTQSFRGYNTEEVDDFLDDLFKEATSNNKQIEDLKKKIKVFQSGTENTGNELSQEETYSIIANAQEEADKIVENARKKAHALIESAEKAQMDIETVPLSSNGMSAGSVNKLKDTLREMYEKQMAVLDGIDQTEPVIESKIKQMEKASDIPSVSFAGITKEYPKKIPAERDILSEINSIGIGGYKGVVQEPHVVGSVENFSEQQPMQDTALDQEEDIDGNTNEFAFSFAEPTEVADKKASTISLQENEPEDPDDIIAQILRDNNRN